MYRFGNSDDFVRTDALHGQQSPCHANRGPYRLAIVSVEIEGLFTRSFVLGIRIRCVANCTCRRTFALNCLRNGMNVYALARLMGDRGVRLERTYQLNTGGNTDFLNMLDRSRLRSKKVSKTEAVQSQLDAPLAEGDIHVGPADFVPWQKDNKVCFLRMEWRGFGDVPMNLELRLSVEDSPNSAGMGIDCIRCAKLALDHGLGGPLEEISAVTMKHPPRQMRDSEARERLEQWIAGR